jgi:hypothetical protein
MLKRKLLAFVLVFAMIMSVMAPGFAGIDYGSGSGTTSSSPTVYDVIPNVGTVSQAVYTLTVTPSAVNINDVISPVIKVINNNTGKAVTGDDLTNFLNNNNVTVTADTYALQYDSNGDHFISTGDNYVKTITVSQLTYANPNGTNGTDTTDTIKLAVNSDKTAIVVVNANNATVPFLVANYGKIYVTASNADQANIYLGGLTPTINYLSGDTKALETYPETVLIKIPYAAYSPNTEAKAVLYENGKFLANIDLTNLVDINNDGLYDGYKVVLPPLSSANKYTLTIKALVNTPTTNVPYYAIGSVDLDVVAAQSTMVTPKDGYLAAGLVDTVTFTMDNKEPAAKGSGTDNNPVVDLTKNVKFTVKKANGDLEDASKYPLTATDGNNVVNVPTGKWLRVADTGYLTVGNATYGKAFDPTSGKITVSAKLPAGDVLIIEGAYTDYNVNSAIPADKQYSFTIAKLVAKLGSLDASVKEIKANEYRNVEFTLKDIHGNPIVGKDINFNSPVVYVGGTGSAATNVNTSVTTDENGKAVATLFSAFPTRIVATSDFAANKVEIAVAASQQTGSTVVFTIGSNDYTVNGNKVTMDVAPYVKDGRTLVPAKYIADALNAQSYYDAATKVVTFVKGDTIVKFTLGSNVMTIVKNGTTITQTMETKATTVDASGKDVGRTFVLARYLAEAFGYKVDYDATANTVTIH